MHPVTVSRWQAVWSAQMKAMHKQVLLLSALALAAGVAFADAYDNAIDSFKSARQSGHFFSDSYGYAVFPTIAKGGLGVGAAHGRGHVYRHDELVGDSSVTQVSVGFQAGGQAYSEIVFFKDEEAFNRFTSGHLELGADVGAVAITASAGASANTGTGGTASASGNQSNAAVAGAWHNGLAVFTLAKGGAMYEAAVAGQKFSYKPVEVASK
jgi:lipid-binding SYLF domain-containing protein